MRDELDRVRRTLISKSTVLPRSVLAALGIGAAFGLGILAGGVGEARGNAPTDEDVLGAARTRAVVLAHKQGEIKLAYPAELLAPEPKAAAEVPTPVVDKAALNQPPSGQLPPDRPPPEKAPPDKAQAATPAAAKVPVAEDEPAPSEASERPSIQATLAKVLGGAPPAADARPAPVPKTFTLQVASLPQRAAADELSKKLAGQGLHARVVVGEVGGREVFRVRVGSFGERDKAEAAKAKLAMPSFIVSE